MVIVISIIKVAQSRGWVSKQMATPPNCTVNFSPPELRLEGPVGWVGGVVVS